MDPGDVIRVRRHQQVSHDVSKRRRATDKLWFGTAPTSDHLRRFGVVGYAQRSVREIKIVSKGKMFIFIEIPGNFPSGMVSMLLVNTRNIIDIVES